MESDSQFFSEAAQRLFWEGIPAPGEISECWLPPECQATEIEGTPEWSPLTTSSQANQRLELNFSHEVAPAQLWGQALRGGPWTPPIEPATPGTWVWQNGTRLYFWPDQPQLQATSYQVQGRAFATEASATAKPPGEQPSGPLRLLTAEKRVREDFRPDLALEFILRWSHPLDRSRFSPDQVQITPTLKNLRIVCSDKTILVRGRGHAGGYEIDVSENLTDIRGQLLGGVAFAQFQVEREPWFLFPPSHFRSCPATIPPTFAATRWASVSCCAG